MFPIKDSEQLFKTLESYSHKLDERQEEELDTEKEGRTPEIKTIFIITEDSPKKLTSNNLRVRETEEKNYFVAEGMFETQKKTKTCQFHIFRETGFWIVYTKDRSDKSHELLGSAVKEKIRGCYLPISSNKLNEYATKYNESKISGFTSRFRPVGDIRGYSNVTIRIWGSSARKAIGTVEENFLARPSRLEFSFSSKNPGNARVSIDNRGWFSLRKGKFHAFKYVVDDFASYLRENLEKIKESTRLDITKTSKEQTVSFTLDGNTNALVIKLKEFDFNKEEDFGYLETLEKLFVGGVKDIQLIGVILAKDKNGFSASVYDKISKSSFYVDVAGSEIYLSPTHSTKPTTLKRIGNLIQLSFDPKAELGEIDDI
jgi:hypothetical protein